MTVKQSNTSIQETGATHVSSYSSNKETCANTLSIPPSQASFFTQRTIPTNERKWKVIPAKSSYGGAPSVQVSKMVTRLARHYDQDERQSDAAVHWDTMRSVLLKAFAKHGARDFSEKLWLRLIHEGSSKTRVEYCEDSKISLAYFRAIQGHSGGIPIDPQLMGCVFEFRTLGKSIFSQRLFFHHSIYPGESTDSGWTWKLQKTVKEELRDDHTIPQKVHFHSTWKRHQDGVFLGKVFPSTRSRIAFLTNEVTCNHHTHSSASRVRLQSNLSKRRSRPAPKVTLKSN